jgi:multicomponent Na+:H+ antiporter subunit D
MNALVLPLALPLAFAVLGVLLRPVPGLRAPLGVAGAALQLAAAGWLLMTALNGDIHALEMGDWAAPFGIVLVADLTAAIFLVTCAFTAFGVVLHAAFNPIDRPLDSWFFPLTHFLLLGVNGALLTGDVFNLFVWFEVLLIVSFVLMVIGGRRPQLEGGLKYVVINLFSSALFLAGIGILYGKTGSLNMADIALKMQGMENPQLVRSSIALLLASFAIKAGLFPLFFWLPASYHTPQPIVTALFAGLLTKVGVYACLRTVTLFLWDDFAAWQDLFMWVAALTMITGVLGAYAQFEMRRILTFHIISQIGYLVAGLAMFTVSGLAAALFYFIHNNLAKTNLLLLAAAVQRRCGTGDLARLGGLYRAAPLLSLLFLLSALALAGIPPLSGFWAKLGILRAGLEGGFFWLTAAALGVGILTLMSMTKIWGEVFWKAPASEATNAPGAALPATALLASGLFAAAIVLLSVGGEPVFRLSLDAAGQLLEPARYIQAVLGGDAP